MRTASLVVVLLVAQGCHEARVLTPTGADGLRAQVRDLSERVESLSATNAQLSAQLAACAKGAQDRTGISPEAVEATPRLVSVRIGSVSHFEAGPSTASGCVASIYLEPQDGLGRFLQLVGTLEVAVFDLSATGASRALATATFTPLQVRDAFRGGITGSHYTIELPLSTQAWNCGGSVTVRISFVDGLTGATLTAQREIGELKAPAGEASNAK